MFELDVDQRAKGLSRGQRARVGLVLALSHRPPLLVLDEPSSGLDPVVRRDILGAIIRTVADEGRTVLFSSHLLDEVQRVADQIAIIRNGRILITDSLDKILNAHEQLTIRFPSPLSESPTVPGAISVSGDGKEWTVLCNGNRAGIEQQIAMLGAEIVERSQPSLEEIFVARVNQ